MVVYRTRVDPYTPDCGLYECRGCGARVRSDSRVERCEDCGASVRNIAVSRE
ncbi:MAG: rubrerythrin-like domain-containing protein [Haloferacaceae archaeon]